VLYAANAKGIDNELQQLSFKLIPDVISLVAKEVAFGECGGRTIDAEGGLLELEEKGENHNGLGEPNENNVEVEECLSMSLESNLSIQIHGSVMTIWTAPLMRGMRFTKISTSHFSPRIII
jgi:hypothetical protein